MAKKPAPHVRKPEKPVLAAPVPPRDMPPPGSVRPVLTEKKPLDTAAIRASVYAAMTVSTDPRVRLMHGMEAQQGAFARIIAAGATIREVSAWLADCEASRGEFMLKVFEG